MTNITECDGCGIRIGNGLREQPLGTSGKNAMSPSPESKPEGWGIDFHWCRSCAEIAYKAVAAAPRADAPYEERVPVIVR